MAVSQDDLLIKIQADTTNASVNIEKLSTTVKQLMAEVQKVSGHTAGAEKSLQGMGASALYLNQSLELAKKGFETVKKVLESTVFKFLEGEEHTKRLSNALKIMGSNSVGATTEHFKNLAAEMTNLTGVQDEAVQDMARLGVTMGLSTDQVDRYIRAAADASAATGIDMTSAFDLVTQTLRGQTRGLASIIPEVKNFTEEQAKAGKAADYFAERMKGFAGANADNFSVTMKKNAIALEDLQKSIGSVLSEILNLGGGKSIIGDVLKSATNLVNEYRDTLIEIGRSTVDFFQRVADAVVSVISGMVTVVSYGLGGFTAAIGSITGSDTIKKMSDDFLSFGDKSKEVMKEAAKDIFTFQTGIIGAAKATNSLNEVAKKGKIEAPVDPKIIAQAAEYQKALSEIQKKTDELNLSAKESGMTQLEILDEQLKMINKVIDAKKRQIDADVAAGKYSKKQGEGLKAGLEEQRQSEGSVNQSKKDQAPGQEYEQAIIAGKSMTNDITKAFQSGTMGMVTGMLGAVDAFVGAAQAVVDFLPGLLDKIANLFNSLTDLPNKIVSSLDGALKSVLNFISNFIPNFLKSIPQIMKMVIKFLVEGIPQAFDALFKAIPDLVIQLVDAIPDFVAGFIQQLIQNIPLIVISFIESIIPQIPKITFAIVRVMAIEIPKAIIRGIIQGINAVINAAKNMFKGVKVVDSKEIGKAVKDIKKLSGSTADMFGVKDLGGSGDTVKQGANQIGDAIKNGMDAGMKMLIDAWRWINDKIIAPIGNFFKGMFDGVVDGAKRLFGFFKDLFDRYTSFLGNIFNGIKNVGSTIIDTFKNIGNIIIDGIKGGLPALGKMFQKLFDELNPANLFKKMFDVSGADGQGTVEKTLGIDIPFLKFAQGGHVPGNARVSGDSLINDRILALLSPGEAVIPRSLMEDKRIRAIIDQILKGDFVPPAFKLGGYAGQISDKVSSATNGAGGTLGKVLSGDFKGAASDIEHMDAKQAGEELAKAGENALKIIESMLPAAPWKMVWEKVQDMVMKMFGANKFASGGFVTGASGTDMIPARLTAGEFVLNKDAVANIGLGNLNRMNNGGRSSMTPTSITQHIDIKIESKGERIDESFIRQRLMPALKEELRRASLDGERLLSSGGVR